MSSKSSVFLTTMLVLAVLAVAMSLLLLAAQILVGCSGVRVPAAKPRVVQWTPASCAATADSRAAEFDSVAESSVPGMINTTSIVLGSTVQADDRGVLQCLWAQKTTATVERECGVVRAAALIGFAQEPGGEPEIITKQIVSQHRLSGTCRTIHAPGEQ